MFNILAQASKGRTKAANDRTAFRGRKPSPATSTQDRYSESESEFLRAYDRIKRETGRTAPDAGLLREVMASLGYVGAASEADYAGAVAKWRKANGRMFAPATATFGIMIGLGYRKGGTR